MRADLEHGAVRASAGQPAQVGHAVGAGREVVDPRDRVQRAAALAALDRGGDGTLDHDEGWLPARDADEPPVIEPGALVEAGHRRARDRLQRAVAHPGEHLALAGPVGDDARAGAHAQVALVDVRRLGEVDRHVVAEAVQVDVEGPAAGAGAGHEDLGGRDRDRAVEVDPGQVTVAIRHQRPEPSARVEVRARLARPAGRDQRLAVELLEPGLGLAEQAGIVEGGPRYLGPRRLGPPEQPPGQRGRGREPGEQRDQASPSHRPARAVQSRSHGAIVAGWPHRRQRPSGGRPSRPDRAKGERNRARRAGRVRLVPRGHGDPGLRVRRGRRAGHPVRDRARL